MKFRTVGTLAVLILGGAGLQVQAQTYPVKPIRAIVPGGTGGPVDTSARAVAQALSQRMGQSVVVDNRPGANGIIGVEACVKAAPDGYTMCVSQMGAISINPFIYPKLSYNPPRDLSPVTLLGVTTDGIAVNSSVRAASMRELMQLAKAKPGALNWGSWGNTSISYLHLAWLQKQADVSFTSISYKAADQAVVAIGTGEIDVLLSSTGNFVRGNVQEKVRVIAITGAKRSANFPGIPTLVEQGFDLDFPGGVGVFVPAGTPREVVTRLNGEINRLLADAAFVKRFLAPFEIEPSILTPEEFTAFLKRHRDTAELLFKTANIRIE
ncbi:MAG: tripartite tricarboxylate transporter substrate binding protein [Betaproteobacteria bacterium]|nr:tripartite tricarboxylate transporter substrate binding protein [Betaproteobacteria bacterium]